MRRGWTTGACAAGASRAAYTALLTGAFPDLVVVPLPGGERPAFALSREFCGSNHALAAIIKDAGDDPDVTHLAEVVCTVRRSAPGGGVRFTAGEGVGRVTLPGLPVPAGEPAINPAPRAMMQRAVAEVARAHGGTGDVEIEIAIPGGAALATKTWNPRLGIVGGLSILGTTGIVVPYSCAAWIHAIHSGVDVARASGLTHVAGCTGSTSERAVQRLYRLPDIAMLDMGDFAGGLLKYLRRHPVARLTIGGGFAKISKLGAGHLDLHSGRSQVDLEWLAGLADELGGPRGGPQGGNDSLGQSIRSANTANQALELARQAGVPLADEVARRARQIALGVLGGVTEVEVLIIDRGGRLRGRSNG